MVNWRPPRPRAASGARNSSNLRVSCGNKADIAAKVHGESVPEDEIATDREPGSKGSVTR
jgi:hypothetical protein